MKKKLEYIFKILVVGDVNVGKTSIIYRYIEEKFLLNTKKTIGVEISVKTLLYEGTKYNLQIWDLGGEKAFFRYFHKTFSVGADIGVIIFDLTNRETILNVPEWIKLCRSWNENVPIILVGNKSDLKERIEISSDIGKELKSIFNCKKYIKTSARTGVNIDELFVIIIREIEEFKKSI